MALVFVESDEICFSELYLPRERIYLDNNRILFRDIMMKVVAFFFTYYIEHI